MDPGLDNCIVTHYFEQSDSDLQALRVREVLQDRVKGGHYRPMREDWNIS
jgi:hypothetical protein